MEDLEIGPVWNGGCHTIDGEPVDFDGEASEQDLQNRLVGRFIVGVRLESDYLAYLRLDDGTHVGFQGVSAQSTDLLICHLWPKSET